MGMKGVLRSLLNFELNGEPTIPHEQLVRNYEILTNARGFEWSRPDDQRIWGYIRQHFAQVMALPSPNVLSHFFQGDIEIEERLKDIAATAPFTRTDFAWLVKDTVRAQRAFALGVASKVFANILQKKTEVEEWDEKKQKMVKVKYEGEADASRYMNGVLARFEESSGEDPVPIRTAAQMLAKLSPPKWLCEGLRLTPLVGSTMLAGYGFSGKSMIAQHLALCVATGSPLFGIHPVKRGRALHLDFEQGAYLTDERYQRLARGMGLDFDALREEGSFSSAIFPKIQLDAPEAESILRRKVQGYDLLIVDSFRASCPKTEENSSEARAPLDMLSRVTGGKCVPLVIHHGKKQDEEKPSSPTQSIRGSSAFFDALGGCYHIGGTSKGGIRVTHIKERLRGVCVDSFLLRIVDVPSPDGSDPKWGVRIEVMAEDDAEAREGAQQCAMVLQVIVQHPDITLSDLRLRCKGLGAEALGETLLHLADTDHIEIKKGPKNSRLHNALRTTYERSAPSMEVEELMNMA
jgi:hypothetical protein